MSETVEHEHIVSVLVCNKPGVLRRVANLFARRGFNISSISVGEAKDPGLSRLTIVVRGNDRIIEQIEKQLYKVIEVVKVSPIAPSPEKRVEREMALIKVQIDEKTKLEILQLVEIFRGKIIDVANDGMIVEITGARSKAEAFIKLVESSGKIVEIARTGIVAMNRWNLSKKEA